MKTNLPLKKSKPSYDFSRLANSFSNPDLVENVNPSKATKSNNNIPLTDNSILSDYQGFGSRLSSSSFNTPYAKTVSIVPSVREKDWVSCDNSDSKRRKKISCPKKNPPRGKCFDWEHCEQCSLTVDCGVCSNCCNKNLK